MTANHCSLPNLVLRVMKVLIMLEYCLIHWISLPHVNHWCHEETGVKASIQTFRMMISKFLLLKTARILQGKVNGINLLHVKFINLSPL